MEKSREMKPPKTINAILILVYVLVIPMAVLALYQLFMGDTFIPTKSWFQVGVVIALICSFLLIGACFVLEKVIKSSGRIDQKVRLKLYQHTRKKKVPSWLAGILIYPLFSLLFYCAFAEAGAGLYTKYIGKDYESSIAIPKKSDANISGRTCPGRYTMKSPQLYHTSIMNTFCVMRDDYRLLPEKAAIKVFGKESPIGRTIAYYEIIKTPQTDEQLEIIDKKWSQRF